MVYVNRNFSQFIFYTEVFHSFRVYYCKFIVCSSSGMRVKASSGTRGWTNEKLLLKRKQRKLKVSARLFHILTMVM